MSALSDYVKALETYPDVLDYARHRDAMAQSLLSYNKDRRGMRPEDRKRYWTRQDKNRWEHECELMDCNYDHNKVGEPKGRTWTRVAKVCVRIKRRPITPYHQAALAEAQRLGTYSILAPLIIEATEAHNDLMRSWGMNIGDYYQDVPIDGAEERHKRAVDALKLHILPDAPTTEPDLGTIALSAEDVEPITDEPEENGTPRKPRKGGKAERIVKLLNEKLSPDNIVKRLEFKVSVNYVSKVRERYPHLIAESDTP